MLTGKNVTDGNKHQEEWEESAEPASGFWLQQNQCVLLHLHCRCTTVFSRSRCLAAVDSHEHVSKGPFSPSFLTFFKRKRRIKSQDEGNCFRMEKVEEWWCNRKQNLAHISFLQQACFSH